MVAFSDCHQPFLYLSAVDTILVWDGRLVFAVIFHLRSLYSFTVQCTRFFSLRLVPFNHFTFLFNHQETNNHEIFSYLRGVAHQLSQHFSS